MSGPSSQADSEKRQKLISKHHDILTKLITEAHRIDEEILDSQINLVRSYSAKTGPSTAGSGAESIKEMRKLIAQHKNTAAAVYCELSPVLASEMSSTKDLIGVFAMLAAVENDNLNNLLAEFVGFETMMGLVCRTKEGMTKLTKASDGDSSFLDFASKNNTKITARFRVFCLEELTPYAGEFIPNDPEKKLDLPPPKRADGSCPDGFVGFAVNVITIDASKLIFFTESGPGLRETLFYNVFKRAQVYNTRRDLLNARTLLTNGGFSLDGTILKENGVLLLGNRKDVGVKFLVSPPTPHLHIEVENKLKKLRWEGKIISDDIFRLQQLLHFLKN